WYEKAADRGNVDGMLSLALFYDVGFGVPQDYAKAREWYQKAADNGDADAMYNLGFYYQTGRGVAQDYTQARAWFQKAADKGNTDAKEGLKELPAAPATSHPVLPVTPQPAAPVPAPGTSSLFTQKDKTVVSGSSITSSRADFINECEQRCA